MSKTDKATLQAALKDLESNAETVRERAVKSICAAFDRKTTAVKLAQDGGNLTWMILFQGMFQAYQTQLEKCISKLGLATVLVDTDTRDRSMARLAEVVATLRLLVDRTKEVLNKPVRRALFRHLSTAFIRGGKPMALVSADYASTIASILTWKPHLQSLPTDTWHTLLAISFNVVLDLPSTSTLMDSLEAYDSDSSGQAQQDASMSPVSDSGSLASHAPSTHKRLRETGKGKPKKSRILRPSAAQLNFMKVVSILLHSPTAPVLHDPNNESGDPHAFPCKVLNYFDRFLRLYPVDTSLRHDFLSALSAALGHFTLNCRMPVASFATSSSWDSLVSMWGTKDQDKNDDMIIVLRRLFPVRTAASVADEASTISTGSLATLWSTAEEVNNKHGPNLLLSALQLRLLARRHCAPTKSAFVSETFEYGWGFSKEQALAWAALELQADCAEKLYAHTESTYYVVMDDGKRRRMDHPISVILESLKSPSRSKGAQQRKTHHLQVLLFIIEKHWSVLHEALRRDFIISLTSLVSFEHTDIQSWTFLCLAAIAHADSTLPLSASSHPPDVSALWDPVWTHAIRRANVPAVSRAACHAAHALLLYSKRLLSPQRVLVEIESFVKDLDVQGPAHPCDSVCGFMVLCLRFANQDVRLYRLQMEEKVLSWLMEAWKIDGERKTSMPAHTVAHIHSLLEAITSSSQRAQLRSEIMLPPSLIVDAVTEEMRTEVIRDFQLNAHLPPFAPALSSSVPTLGSSALTNPDSPDRSFGQHVDSVNLAPPRGRERRLSAFLLKSLEATHQRLGQDSDSLNKATVETLRAALDVAVVVLFFEGSLLMNGTQPNRRTIQAACGVLCLISPSLAKEHWEPQERRLLLGALDPLMLMGDDHTSNGAWEALVSPGERSGIRMQVLQRLLDASQTRDTDTILRQELQRCVFHSLDVQAAVAELFKHLREVLRLTMERVSNEGSPSVGDRDDFAPVLELGWSTEAAQKVASAVIHHKHITEACVTALSVIPTLQSLSGEPTRDKQLIELLTECDSPEFLVLAPPCLNHVEHKRLHLNSSNLKGLLEQVDWLCTQYAFKHNEEAQLLIVRTLEATSHLWRSSLVIDKDLREKIEAYCSQCVELLRNKDQPSWRVRDAIICFLDKYLAQDPAQEYWPSSGATEDLPAAVIPTFGDDDDVRIRFRVAAVSPRLFAVSRLADDKPTDLYHYIRLHLSTSELHFERILTRLLSLGNMVISDASVRRGAYWHLLEVAFYTKTYYRHLKAVLMGITTRLGMERFSDLFNSYASQFAYSIRMSNIDIFDFPSDLLGYRNRRECAEATFRAFTPTNLLEAGNPEEIEIGKDLFARHCQTVQKTEQDGIRECFADIVAHHITHCLEQSPGDVEDVFLKRKLMEKTGLDEQEQAFQDLFRRNVEGVVVAILRTLGDQDVSGNGPIITALREASMDDAADVFLSITKYRAFDTFDAHEPNLPRYGAHLILHALDWYRGQVEHADSPAVTYHVLHHLFADVERSCLVNEQYRSLNALCLWIAGHHVHFQEETLLRILIRRASILLTQCDLARSAQSLLEWSLSLYRIHSARADYRLTDVLIHISTHAHEFSGTPYLATLGSALMTWIEAQAESLCMSKPMRKQTKRALAAWPRELPASLQSHCEGLQLADLISSLSDHGISSSKFRLVRKFYEVASSGEHREELERLGSSGFWRLKAHIPPNGSLVDNDIDAFTSLLILHCGHINSLSGDQFVPETVLTRHRRAANKTAGHAKELVAHADVDLAHEAIILSLLAMLDIASASQVYTAYQTLCSLTSVPSSIKFVGLTLSSDVQRELEYLRAFPKPRGKPPLPDLPSILRKEESLHLASDFPSWITRTAELLSNTLGTQDPFFSPLAPILLASHTFAEEILPVLVHSLLQIEFDQRTSDSSTSFKTLLSQYFSSVLAYEGAAPHCHRTIIEIVLHLRSFQPSKHSRDALSNDKWLSIDFTLLGRRAIKCGAYTTALLFLELDSECSSTRGDGRRASTEDVLFEIYSHIDEPDGFYGIQTRDLRNLFVRRLRHENQWDTAFRYHGAVVEAGAAGCTDTNGVVQALYSFGFNRLALSTLQALSGSSDSLGSSALAYSLAWRAETWDLPKTLATDHSGATLYLAMRAIYRERSQQLVDNVLRHSCLSEMGRLRDLGNENFTEIRQVTQNLMCLGQIRRWRTGNFQRELLSSNTGATKWDHFTSVETAFEFSDIEAIMATRISLIRSLLQKERRDQIGDIRSPLCKALQATEKACLLCLSERARCANEPQVALNSVVRALNLEQNPSPGVTREFSNVLWLMKEPQLAIQSLTELASATEVDLSADLSVDAPVELQRASLLAQLGTWSAEASLKKPSQIVAECFKPAVDAILASNVSATAEVDRSAALVFHQYAIFAERQYHAISKSPDALRWKLYIDRKKEEIKRRAHELQRLPANSSDRHQLGRQQDYAQVLLKQDKQRAQEHLGQRTAFLSLAVEMYSRCLAASDAFDDDSPIRLSSLWLANFDNDDTALGFDAAFERVPSRKFVFLAHQLTARLSGSEQGNQIILQGIIRRMCNEHPFHSLFPLYCIKADQPASQESSGRRQSGRQAIQTQTQTPTQAERGAAAAEIFAKLSSSGGRSAERVNSVEYICSASLQWAQHPIKGMFVKGSRPPKHLAVPDNLDIRRVKDVKVPVITTHTPIDPTTDYRDCVWISHYDASYTTAGGVNLPKITNCIGSDGKKYKQLYKGEGNDDLRQDAVMEQVFDLVNIVLKHDRETKRRKLSVRGYKVIPLAAQAGVLEFVDNTTPLADWLRPAHLKYRPQDLSQDQVSKRMAMSYRTEWRDDPEKVLARFRQVRERFKPVMRHYFTEKHKTPMSWYTMRLHYARSVATNSIVGHILGLGDRHTSNILIDNKTGEVIHIDLGIAFEQGKFLPQPERVPFRLTADIVDGLGISGTQGVFQRCAEETLRVLRDGSEIILTVLEVFKYDPLHSWTASDLKIKRVQANVSDETAQLTEEAFRFAVGIDMASGAAHEAADRALSTVARKLDKTLSVEYTVNELITEASDPSNLGLMYMGWAPHM